MIISQYPLYDTQVFTFDDPFYFLDDPCTRLCRLTLFLNPDLTYSFSTTYGLYTHILVADKLVESTV
jgi:hypothetical protein